MRVSIPFLCAAALLTGACQSEPSAPVVPPVIVTAAADVAASRVEGGVQLTNDTGEPILYAVWNSGWLALFAPCVEAGPGCPRLAPGDTVTVPDANIQGWSPDASEAVVRWWRVVPDGAGGMKAVDVHEIFVAL